MRPIQPRILKQHLLIIATNLLFSLLQVLSQYRSRYFAVWRSHDGDIRPLWVRPASLRDAEVSAKIQEHAFRYTYADEGEPGGGQLVSTHPIQMQAQPYTTSKDARCS
ncbi:hypothetical protein C8Q79DRAFT_538522 [Trametes meyenii]|nr:hypothetical protein C8Q79DRAFT_538522 [Trametes meyenii]